MKTLVITGIVIALGYVGFKRYQQHVNKMPNIEY
ncbi:DUF2648 domain-containing protein [Staphylococcus felis]|uniref:DUF2648 domain-containing protein n=1 Tax=Staphylococcus felis TaxID=46127 RepID=A0A2K3ZK03_9STAP|nr:SE2200 family small protein [Staphylococcus felis]AVP36145.1 DUF2648 domain-containing protein [Staphylococcus felis]MBH9580520.1 DUF2648 domain-containing protein [Staphylococcus felis]MDM8328376.1 SE2200 family small protein [Staphylococcus felis]MDQ7192753.1 SE2200 family small protein [Staphylococcus felis]PNZ37838.1 DUF2648 domain-containing protein [Staphylococcus felis]